MLSPGYGGGMAQRRWPACGPFGSVCRMNRYPGMSERRYSVRFAVVLAWLAFLPASAHAEAVLGASNATVTLVEYGSLTCDYCVKFHREVLPQLKRRYIDSGRVRFIYRDFPTSAAAMRGAIAARCAGPDRYYAMLDALYWSVGKWSRAKDVDSALVEQATALGLKAAAFRACLKEPQHEQTIEQERRKASKEPGVLGTPTFLVDGQIVRGLQSLEQLETLITRASGRANRVDD